MPLKGTNEQKGDKSVEFGTVLQNIKQEKEN